MLKKLIIIVLFTMVSMIPIAYAAPPGEMAIVTQDINQTATCSSCHAQSIDTVQIANTNLLDTKHAVKIVPSGHEFKTDTVMASFTDKTTAVPGGGCIGTKPGA